MTVVDLAKLSGKLDAAGMAAALGYSLPWSNYIRTKPTAKQLAFILLPHREALYGGAAGGGKSEALLMLGLQYASFPGHASIIFRRQLTDFKEPQSLIARAHEWLDKTDARWDGQVNSWYFPTVNPDGSEGTNSVLSFGYLKSENGATRYKSAEYQDLLWEEVTEHKEPDYRFLFSRNRKKVCPEHPVKDGQVQYEPTCPFCQIQSKTPLRVRGATNPPETSVGIWVKSRFSIVPEVPLDECRRRGIRPRYIGTHPLRPFVPAFVTDNPFVDQAAYLTSLSHLDPARRDQLAYGDWGRTKGSKFNIDDCRYYDTRGPYFLLGDEQVHYSDLIVFGTIDPAASSKEGPGDVLLRPKDAPSWTVISIWGRTSDYRLLWLDMVRFRREVPEVVSKVKETYRKWPRCEYMVIEKNGMGVAVYQYLMANGVPVRGNSRHTDKVVNATQAMIWMSQGKVWLPITAPWLQTAQDEVFSWAGGQDEEDDVVDTLADAARSMLYEAAGFDAAKGDPEAPYGMEVPFLVEDSTSFSPYSLGPYWGFSP